MPPNVFLAMALSMAVVSANPVKYVARQTEGPDACPYNDQPGGFGTGPATYFVADVRFFSDPTCSTMTGFLCFSAPLSDSTEGQPGDYYCGGNNLGDTAPLYAQMAYTLSPNVQIDFTLDASCPPGGAGAVFASLIDNNACVELSKVGPGVGISIYPDGGSPVNKRSLENVTTIEEPKTIEKPEPVEKRQNSCSGFTISSQEASESDSEQVSNIVNCLNGDPNNGCAISPSEQYTQEVSSTYSLSASAGDDFIVTFDVTTEFGMEYTTSETSSIQYDETVAVGQAGYLSVFSAATLFTGTFTGCNFGDESQAGQSLVIKSNTLSYLVVNTGTP